MGAASIFLRVLAGIAASRLAAGWRLARGCPAEDVVAAGCSELDAPVPQNAVRNAHGSTKARYLPAGWAARGYRRPPLNCASSISCKRDGSEYGRLERLTDGFRGFRALSLSISISSAWCGPVRMCFAHIGQAYLRSPVVRTPYGITSRR